MLLAPPIVPIVIGLGFIIIIAIAQIMTSIFFPVPISYFSLVVNIVGLLLFISGSTLIVWAKITMGRVWGIPGKHDIKQQKD